MNYRKTNKQIVIITIMLAVPAFVINLGMFGFTGDEAIRTLVAFEMQESGNFIATTMHGTDYINKPPLWNWFILLISWIWGSFGEWPTRICTVLSLFSFAWLNYRVLKSEFGKSMAFLISVMLITNGRILFYDSMLGLIDTAFSLTIYALFMVIYKEGKQGNWLRMYVWSYLLMTVGFMFKGLPAVVFQGLTLFTAMLFFRQFKKLFTWQHIIGGISALVIIGAYLGILSFYRPMDVYLQNLFFESSQRTVVVHGWSSFWFHVIEFPLRNIYDFLPWSILIIFWFDRKFWTKILKNEFVRYNFWILSVNLFVYWTSPQVEPRYMLMFIPLWNTIGIYLIQASEITNWRNKLLFSTYGFFIFVAGILMLIIPWVEITKNVQHIIWIGFSAGIAFLIITWLYFQQKQRRLMWFVIALLVARICFDLIVLPIRTEESIVTQAKNDVLELAEKYPDKHWYVYGDAYIREPASFYLTNKVGYIIERTWKTDIPNSIYLVSHQDYETFPGKCLDTLQTDYNRLQIRIHLFNNGVKQKN